MSLAVRLALRNLLQAKQAAIPARYLHALEAKARGPGPYGVQVVNRRFVAGELSRKWEVRPMCYVTLTIDHRVLDGYQANAFLARWVEEIEGWG
jgi:pyruvate/2-oxoglutarate dehydrogenase complex dihydrolipoamide acyltransferase (E2) component